MTTKKYVLIFITFAHKYVCTFVKDKELYKK